MKDKLRKVILFVCVCVFAYSAVQLGKIFYDYYMIEKESEDLITEYVKEEKKEDEKENPLHRVVNFKSLQKKNADVIGWIYIPGTKIDEPVLKGKNNDTYLYHDIYKKHNIAGSIFVDEINKTDFKDKNTIIYGHNMKNGSRFHNLRYFIKQDYFKEHPKVYIYLPDGSINVYDIFASSVISAYDELYANPSDYHKYLNTVLKKSKQKREVNKEESPFIMLSTCYGDTDDRYVIFGKLNQNVKADQ